MQKTIILLLLIFGSVFAVVGQNNVQLQVGTDVIINGESAPLPVTASNFTDVLGFQFTLGWSSSALQIDSVRSLTLAGFNEQSYNINEAAGTIQLLWTDPSGTGFSLPDGSEILELFFSVAGSPLEINPVEFQANPTPPSIAQLVNGEFTEYQPFVSNGQLELIEPLLINFFATTGVSCYGAQDGSIQLDIAGGAPPYDINWDNDSTGVMIEQLMAGNYEATIIDQNEQLITASFTVSSPDSLALNANLVPISCVDEMDGSIALDVTGGTMPYTFEWSTADTTPIIDLLASGHYLVTVTDANNCIITEEFEITSPEISLNIEVNYGCGDGLVRMNANLFGPPDSYDFLWSTGDTTTQVFNVFSGIYFLTVTNSSGCMATDSVEVDFIAPLVVESEITQIDCNGHENGSIDLTIGGSIPPYDILWTDGNMEEDRTNLAPNNYSVNVSTGDECNLFLSFDIFEPSPISVDLIIDESPPGLFEVTAAIQGGTAPYTVAWSSGDTSIVVSNLPMGEYQLEITDQNGCVLLHTFMLGVTDVNTIENLSSIHLYPNPNEGFFYLEHPFLNPEFQPVLFTLDGRAVPFQIISETTSLMKIVIEKPIPGTYLLQLSPSLSLKVLVKK